MDGVCCEVAILRTIQINVTAQRVKDPQVSSEAYGRANFETAQ